MKRGAIRLMVDQLQVMARMSGMTIEQAADVYDAIADLTKPRVESSTDEPIQAQGPKDPQ